MRTGSVHCPAAHLQLHESRGYVLVLCGAWLADPLSLHEDLQCIGSDGVFGVRIPQRSRNRTMGSQMVQQTSPSQRLNLRTGIDGPCANDDVQYPTLPSVPGGTGI